MLANPQVEHEQLQQLVGEWTYEAEVLMGPDQPPESYTGTEHVRSLGGLWVVAEGQGKIPVCGETTTLMTLGYDPQKQKYVGTWAGSMMTHLWSYEGEMDASNQVLTLSAEGPAMVDNGTMAQYRDVIEFKTADHRIMTSHLLGEDGQWHQFMTAHYWRKH